MSKYFEPMFESLRGRTCTWNSSEKHKSSVDCSKSW